MAREIPSEPEGSLPANFARLVLDRCGACPAIRAPGRPAHPTRRCRLCACGCTGDSRVGGVAQLPSRLCGLGSAFRTVQRDRAFAGPQRFGSNPGPPRHNDASGVHRCAPKPSAAVSFSAGAQPLADRFSTRAARVVFGTRIPSSLLFGSELPSREPQAAVAERSRHDAALFGRPNRPRSVSLSTTRNRFVLQFKRYPSHRTARRWVAPARFDCIGEGACLGKLEEEVWDDSLLNHAWEKSLQTHQAVIYQLQRRPLSFSEALRPVGAKN